MNTVHVVYVQLDSHPVDTNHTGNDSVSVTHVAVVLPEFPYVSVYVIVPPTDPVEFPLILAALLIHRLIEPVAAGA